MSVVVDSACTQIWEAWENGSSAASLRVSPAVYTAVAAARPAEVAHDYPLMLLSLPLIADPEVATYDPAGDPDGQGPAQVLDARVPAR
jgi:hypothetical protein